MNNGDIGMIELGESYRFPAEALSHLFIGECPGGQNFNGNISFQAFVPGPVNDTHAAGPDFFDEAIVAKSLTYHGGSLLEIQPNCKYSPSPNKVDGMANYCYQTLYVPIEFEIPINIIGILYHRLVIDVKLLNLLDRKLLFSRHGR
jgi:hypothetical protein